MTRSPWFRAGLFLLVVAALLVSGAGHVVFHGDHDHGHGHDIGEGDWDCAACDLQVAPVSATLVMPSVSLAAQPAPELGPESPHARSERGRAAPRAPPVCV